MEIPDLRGLIHARYLFYQPSSIRASGHLSCQWVPPHLPDLTPQFELQAHISSSRVLCVCLHCAMKLLGHRLADLFSLAFTEDQAPGSSSTMATK